MGWSLRVASVSFVFLVLHLAIARLTRLHTVDIPLIGYSPVGRGFLTGQVRKLDDLDETDWRRYLPRFQPAVFDQNIKLADAVGVIAERKGAALASVAISWARCQGVIPIPGTVTMERLVENTTDVDLSEEDLAEIQRLLETLPVAGQRYGGRFEELLNA